MISITLALLYMELFSSLTLITYYFDAGEDKEQLLITASYLSFPLLFFICSPISGFA